MLNSELKSGANVKSSAGEEEKKFNKYIAEVEEMGFKLLPPDINYSEPYFTKEGEKGIRFGFVGIKNVGISPAEFITEVRVKTGKYKSYEDFVTRTDSRLVNKKVIEALIMSGAMDGLYEKNTLDIEDKCIFRKRLMLNLEKNGVSNKPTFSQQEFLFSEQKQKDISIEKYSEQEIFEEEHSLTGIYWSGHPLEKHLNEINAIAKMHIETLPEEDGREVELIGMVTSIKKGVSKSGKPWAKFNLEDLTSEIEVLAFPEVYNKYHDVIHKNAIIFLKGRISLRETQKSIVAQEIYSFDKIKEKIYKKHQKIFISISSVGMDDEYINSIKKFLTKYPGEVQVYFNIITKNSELVTIETDYKIIPSSKMLSELRQIVGESSYKFE